MSPLVLSTMANNSLCSAYKARALPYWRAFWTVPKAFEGDFASHVAPP